MNSEPKQYSYLGTAHICVHIIMHNNKAQCSFDYFHS